MFISRLSYGFKKRCRYYNQTAINKVLPDEAVIHALKNKVFNDGKLYVVAAGKAAWQMANKASEILKDKIYLGFVITKYDHVKGKIDRMDCYEAGHPVPDRNSFIATEAALNLTKDLNKEDTVLFLSLGGGSALFEKASNR